MTQPGPQRTHPALPQWFRLVLYPLLHLRKSFLDHRDLRFMRLHPRKATPIHRAKDP